MEKINEIVIGDLSISLCKKDVRYEEQARSQLSDVKESLFKYGLVCQNGGFGFLLVKEFTANSLLIQDPLSPNVFRYFKNLKTANVWINSFLRKHMIFESNDTNLKWVKVKTSDLKDYHPFDKSLIEEPSKYVSQNGILIDMPIVKQTQTNSNQEIILID